MSDLRLVNEVTERPKHLSLIAKTFEAEIKRVASETGSEIGKVTAMLATASGVSENHIYNYRTGRTDIPATQIRVFCSIFRSNALSSATACEEADFDYPDEGFDLVSLCNRATREMLECGQVFVEVFADGKVDGHEEIRLATADAALRRTSRRMFEAARHIRRRSLNNPGPVAA